MIKVLLVLLDQSVLEALQGRRERLERLASELQAQPVLKVIREYRELSEPKDRPALKAQAVQQDRLVRQALKVQQAPKARRVFKASQERRVRRAQ